MILRSEYKPTNWSVTATRLEFDIRKSENFSTVVKTTSHVSYLRKTDSPTTSGLFLHGEGLVLEQALLNGRQLEPSEYRADTKGFSLFNPPQDPFTLALTTTLSPESNTALSGLYKSGEILLSQCEPEGFRRITFYLDRPDILSPFEVTIEADKQEFPVLLAGGNRGPSIEVGTRHRATFIDPFPKPCYLFAIVAGPLALLEDHFTTCRGRRVRLEMYNSAQSIDHCRFALESLKKAMTWDEARFGLEYDLDEYRIVGTEDFNGGAMENKGLNIFNNKYLLADPQASEDRDFLDVESVVAHEYFHNWTGNRVTLKNWFELSLKEGLTVFRDQQFSADVGDPDDTRIENILTLRARQFVEDAGPNSHAVRPDSSESMNNLFSSTIYEKGAQILHLIQAYIGKIAFAEGLKKYLYNLDGQAAQIEDLIASLQSCTPLPVTPFLEWYSQSGTPKVSLSLKPSDRGMLVEIAQSRTGPNPESSIKALLIPLSFTVYNSQGLPLALSPLSGHVKNTEGKSFLVADQLTQTFEFRNWPKGAVISLNRGFAAPILLETNETFEELIYRLDLEQDPVNLWLLWTRIQADHLEELVSRPEHIFRRLLCRPTLSTSLRARLLGLPLIGQLLQRKIGSEGPSLLALQDNYRRRILNELKLELGIYTNTTSSPDHRRLANLSWFYLSMEPSKELEAKLMQIWRDSPLFNDRLAAFRNLLQLESIGGMTIISEFEKRCSSPGQFNKLLEAVAESRASDTGKWVQQLINHPRFNRLNPNNVFSLIYRFGANIGRFHDTSANHYEWYSRFLLEIDRLNPETASRCLSAFDQIHLVSQSLQSRAAESLQPLLTTHLSPNCREKVEKILSSLG